MKTRAWILALALAAPGGAAAPGPASIVHLALPGEDSLLVPIAIPSEPGNTVEIDFPLSVYDWAGRGFTPDADKYAGDLVIEATRGTRRLFVTPMTEGAHRVLHVVLGDSQGRTRSLPIEFIPAPANVAWRKVVFTLAEAKPRAKPAYRLADQAPGPELVEASPSSQLGLLGTLRLMAGAAVEDLPGIAAANPDLALATFDPAPRSFDAFSVTCRFAVRDAATGSLGLCVGVANLTARRLLFDPLSWVVRVGDHVYPATTADFPGELEPGATRPAYLVIARSPDGSPTRLLPDNVFLPSVALLAAVSPRPVSRLSLREFDPR